MAITNSGEPMTSVQYARGVVYKWLEEASFWHEGSLDTATMTPEEIDEITKEVERLTAKLRTSLSRIK